MKSLFWDSHDPLDCWDNPNCFFDSEGKGKRREKSDEGSRLTRRPRPVTPTTSRSSPP